MITDEAAVDKAVELIAHIDNNENEEGWSRIIAGVRASKMPPMVKINILLTSLQYQMMTGCTPGLVKGPVQ